MIRIALVLAAAGLFAGCSSTQPPTLTVTSAAVKDRTPQGAVLQFTIEADNPNDEALPLQDVTYELTLNGKSVFQGTRLAEATVRRFGRQQFKLPAVVAPEAWPGQPGVPAKYHLSGDVVYVVRGELAQALFDLESLRPTASFSGEGEIDIPTPDAARQ